MSEHIRTALEDEERLREVRSFLQAVQTDQFDRLARLATRALGTPCGLVSLLDDAFQHYAGADGLGEPYLTSRNIAIGDSYCQHVIAEGRPVVIADAREDARTAGSSSITDFGAIAYLGVPLTAPGGQAIGTVCAVEPQRRDWTPEDREVLEDVAELALTQLRLVRAAADADISLGALRTTLDPESEGAGGLVPEDVDLDAVMRSLRSLVAPVVPEGVRLLVDNAPRGVTHLRTDRARLAQLLQTLLGRAAAGTDVSAVHLSVHADEGSLTFAVSDTGTGLTPDELDAELADPASPLGSATVTARALGGTLRVESAPREGTTARALIPRL